MSFAQTGITITVTVDNVPSNKGVVTMALHNKNTFMKAGPIKAKSSKIEDKKVVITFENVTPASNGNDVILPYPMQIGSGTFDPILALTYLAQNDNVSFGSQIKGVFRLGENSNDYRLGNRYSLNNWVALKVTDWLSFSARIEGAIIGEINGANPVLNPNMVITCLLYTSPSPRD